jgi:hypothetical protein
MRNHQHHIIPKSRGGTNEPWNFQEKNAYDHAFDHAVDFVLFDNAPVFDCRHEAWTLLPDDLRNAVREKLSDKMRERFKHQKGENHPQYGLRGEHSVSYGRRHTPESCQKMSLANKGKPKSKEHVEKIKSRPVSQETRQKISEIKKGTTQSKETREKISQATKGIPKTEEHKKKISEASMGNQRWLGRKHSEETRRKMSEAAKNRKKNA